MLLVSGFLLLALVSRRGPPLWFGCLVGLFVVVCVAGEPSPSPLVSSWALRLRSDFLFRDFCYDVFGLKPCVRTFLVHPPVFKAL